MPMYNIYTCKLFDNTKRNIKVISEWNFIVNSNLFWSHWIDSYRESFTCESFYNEKLWKSSIQGAWFLSSYIPQKFQSYFDGMHHEFAYLICVFIYARNNFVKVMYWDSRMHLIFIQLNRGCISRTVKRKGYSKWMFLSNFRNFGSAMINNPHISNKRIMSTIYEFHIQNCRAFLLFYLQYLMETILTLNVISIILHVT